MSQTLLCGIGLVTLGGILQGSFAVPMKRMSGWRWENSWLLFALSALFVLPWIIDFATVPNVISVYAGTSRSTLLKVILFGLLWGVGATLFGLAISRVGMGLGFALILGITSSFGSLIPMAILHSEQLLAKRGLALIAGTAVMVVGLVFLALAGRARQHDLGTGNGARSGFAFGLVLCIFSGIFSSMMNFSFVFGDELRVRALHSGASNAMAANSIWALTLTGGFFANFLYCVYLLNKNRTWSVFYEGNPSGYWLLGLLMGLLWFGGTVLYGMGAASLGALGGIIGWPIFLTVDVIGALLWGAMSGEWRGASRRALVYNWAGVGILLVAIAVISAGNAT
ncbi:MAG TPA: L-rhamnose/proton symporter RhaT [Candidatus Acidoferrum sp.]|jgi:L-rhamnose-H+ transport protein|nr:L-rhamnose/proton symporter RhaT [Candidatus Acidoferrum sp.]